jgi:hypothetical protein
MVKNCKTIEIKKAKNTAITKITGMLAPFIFSSVNPDSLIQIVPNTFGLYQINPITNVDNAATNSAKKLISIGLVLLISFSNINKKCVIV